MRTTATPPPVPSRDGTVYLVLDDFGKFGQAYRETDPTRVVGKMAAHKIPRATVDDLSADHRQIGG
jgi:hypothetical protein